MRFAQRARRVAAGCAAVLLLSAPTRAQDEQPLKAAEQMLAHGELAAAENALRRCVVTNPASARAHFLLGFTLFREDKPIDSLAEYTAGAKYGHPGPEELNTVASDYVLMAAYADADKWLTRSAQMDPDNARTWYLLGRTKYNENRFQEALAAFERSLALSPRDEKSENNLGLCLQALNRNAEARAAYEQAIQWQQSAATQDAQPYLNLGSLDLDMNNAPAALDELQKAAALAPNNARVHEQLGRAYQELNRLSDAQSEYEKAVAIAPRASGIHFKLGQIYRRQGMQAEARREFDTCSRLNSTHSSIETPNAAAP